MEHQHEWTTMSSPQQMKHKEGNRYISYELIQICDCGAYQNKEFLHIEDLKNKGDAEK